MMFIQQLSYRNEFFHLIFDVLFGLWQFDLFLDLLDTVVDGVDFVADLFYRCSEKIMTAVKSCIAPTLNSKSSIVLCSVLQR